MYLPLCRSCLSSCSSASKHSYHISYALVQNVNSLKVEAWFVPPLLCMSGDYRLLAATQGHQVPRALLKPACGPTSFHEFAAPGCAAEHAAALYELMLASILVAALLLALHAAGASTENAVPVPLKHPLSLDVRLDAADSAMSRHRLDDAVPMLGSTHDVQPEPRGLDDSMSVLARQPPADFPSVLRSGDSITGNEFSYDGNGQYTYTFKSPDGQTRLLLYYKKGFIELLTDLAMQNATDEKLVWTASLPDAFDDSISGATLEMSVSLAHIVLTPSIHAQFILTLTFTPLRSCVITCASVHMCQHNSAMAISSGRMRRTCCGLHILHFQHQKLRWL
jgi:hypothetical protein